MEHLLAADVLLGDQAALPISSGGNYSNMANNVFYFASRLVDKVWQGICIFYDSTFYFVIVLWDFESKHVHVSILDRQLKDI